MKKVPWNEFTVRAANVLSREFDVDATDESGEALAIARLSMVTESELFRMRDVGRKTIAEFRDFLAKRGRAFGATVTCPHCRKNIGFVAVATK